MNLSELTSSKLFVLNADVNTKEEVLQQLVKRLYEAGKITSEEGFLQAVLAREELSATGMEGGLAIPHGKSSAVKQACFAVMTTKKPVVGWESLDPDNEVQHIFLLAIPENAAGDTHLELLAELMTRMGDAEYMEKLFASKDAKEFYHNLDNTVGKDDEDVVYHKTMVAVTACPAGIAHTYMAAEALVKAGKELGVQIFVEKQGANGIEDRHTTEQLQNADAVIFAVGVAVKEVERFAHLPSIKVPVAQPIKDGIGVVQQALDKAASSQKGEYVATGDKEGKENHKDIIKQSVLTGISYMIPLIVAGGMIGAFAVLMNNIFGLGELYNDATSWLGLFRGLGGGLLGTLLIPVLSAYMAYSIGDKTALAAGFAAGFAANQIQGGFLAGMAGGLLAGYTVLLLKKKIPSKGTLAGFVSFWVYPVFSTVIVGIMMFLVIGKPIAWLNTTLVYYLQSLSGANAALLGAILGIMVSFDLGGPVNKAAYTFCAGAIAEGLIMPYAVFASVKMVSGFAVTFATMVGKKQYSREEIEVGQSTWILALAGITEGAIPFMMRDPLRVIASLCTGSAITGAIVAACNIGLDVPGAGIFSIFMMQCDTVSATMAAAIWLGAAVVGGVISGGLLIATRKMKARKDDMKEAM
ncbi:PTS 2-O-a-mannosyl-D-glycerate transporter subunit IIABC [Chakrabartyella piscis]|uniref:PTS 2-O-a-mannosyl-D-glycerate transporter subunit IIABC n=1 Tax=Chakrabartyella piscis TaxID=2918914 RepID=UPI0029585B35|nr:PTS 2-O-a-mannosyl-D-glycerate transporter subunit IIABC [Chakrabartyella piscis]